MKILDQKDFYEAGKDVALRTLARWPEKIKHFKEYVKDDDVKKYYHSVISSDIHQFLTFKDRTTYNKYLIHFQKEEEKRGDVAEKKFPERTMPSLLNAGRIIPIVSAIEKIAARHPNGKIQTETREMDHDDYVKIAADHILRGVIDGINEENNK